MAHHTLKKAVRNALQQCVDNGWKSVCLPLLSSGEFGCDPYVSTRLTCEAIKRFTKKNPGAIKEFHVVTWTSMLYDIKLKKVVAEAKSVFE